MEDADFFRGRRVELKYLGLVFLIVVSVVSAAAQQTQSPWLTDVERARFEELRRSGLDALYNIDYDKAQRDFNDCQTLSESSGRLSIAGGASLDQDALRVATFAGLALQLGIVLRQRRR